MVHTRASRRNLLALALAASLALAPLAPVAARGLAPQRHATVEPRQPDRAQHGLWSALWNLLAAVWGKEGDDGAHADPFG